MLASSVFSIILFFIDQISHFSFSIGNHADQARQIDSADLLRTFHLLREVVDHVLVVDDVGFGHDLAIAIVTDYQLPVAHFAL